MCSGKRVSKLVVINIANDQRNVNRNYNEVHLNQSEWPLSTSLQKINAGEGFEKTDLSNTVHGNVNCYSHYGEQCVDSVEN